MVSQIARRKDEQPLARLPRELLDTSGFLLSLLGTSLKSRWADELAESGLNPYHFRVLVLLDEGASNTQAAIADTLELDRSQLVGLLDTLEEGGFIERRPDPEDRRRHMVSLTAAGRRQLTKIRVLARRVEEEYFVPLDSKERETLHDLLLRLAMFHDPRCVFDM
jgi:DNA-binding MarR family transcriptional regulator